MFNTLYKQIALVTLLVIHIFASAGYATTLGHWKFNKGKGKSLTDLTQENRYASVSNATWRGKELYFDGDNDYVDIEISEPISFEKDFFIDVWFKTEKRLGSYHIVSCLDGPTRGFALTVSNGRPFLWLPGEGFKYLEGREVVEENTWHRISGAYSEGTVRLYLDENLIGEQKRTGNIFVSSKVMRLGAMSQSPLLANFQGVIKEVYISETPYVVYSRKRQRRLAKEKEELAKASVAQKKEKAEAKNNKTRKKQNNKAEPLALVVQQKEAAKKVTQANRKVVVRVKKNKTEQKKELGGDILPPQLVEVTPKNNKTGVKPMESISLIFSDPESGIDTNSVVFILNKRRVPVESYLDVVGRFHVRFTPRIGFRPDAMIEFSISVSDKSPRKNTFQQNFKFYTIPDVSPPYLMPYKAGQKRGENKYMVSFYIKDNGWGVYKPSILLKVDGKAVEGLASGGKKKALLTYQLKHPISKGEEVLIEVLASDMSPRRNRLHKTFYWGHNGSLSPFIYGEKGKNKDLAIARTELGEEGLKEKKEPVRTFYMSPGLLKKEKRERKKNKKPAASKKLRSGEQQAALILPEANTAEKRLAAEKARKAAHDRKIKEEKKRLAAATQEGFISESSIAPPHTKKNVVAQKQEWFSAPKVRNKKAKALPPPQKEVNKNIFVPDGMVLISAGEFIQGAWQYPDEIPERVVYLDDFLIDKYPVTEQQYLEFVKETGHAKPKGITNSKKPVVNINWHDANAYAKWKQRRLPTEAEWEKAARGTDGRIWPWGNRYIRANVGIARGFKIKPVGSNKEGASPYGIFDMGENVEEWVNDWYSAKYYKSATNRNPQGPSSGTYKVVKGADGYFPYGLGRSAYRGFRALGAVGSIGFRTALSVK